MKRFEKYETHVHFPIELVTELDKEAERRYMTRTSLIVYILSAFLLGEEIMERNSKGGDN